MVLGLDWLRRKGGSRLPPVGSPRPLFVLGPPRSGTTLAAKLLNAHPQVLVTNETRVLTFFEKAFAEIPMGDRGGLHCARVYGNHLVAAMRVAGRAIIEKAYGAIAKEEGKRDVRYWGDKNPHVSRALDLLQLWFADARLVAVRRDPRDTVCSILELWGRMGLVPVKEEGAQGWDVTDADLVKCCSNVARRLRDEDSYLAQLDAGDVFVLDYEELLRDAPRVLSALFVDFLGFDDVAPAMTAMEALRQKDVHGAVQGEVDFVARSVGRWRRDLRPDHQEIVDMQFGGPPKPDAAAS